MGPEALAQVLRPLAAMFDPRAYPDLVLGLESPDDAAVWKLDDERAIVLTADFFPPVVDDPYGFGQIAAANSLSDLYAMGATPLFGINLVGFPDDLDREILTEILRGGGDKVKEANAAVAGGHTTSDAEPKYGLAVIGLVHPDQMWKKGGAKPGDVLFLTKPLGTGAITTALKNDEAAPEHVDAAIESMSRLHRRAAETLKRFPGALHAATDITGFGLSGHGHEMAAASKLALALEFDSLPILPGALGYLREGNIPGGGRRNREYYGRWMRAERDLSEEQLALLHDPQTSGGLLVAIAADRADEVEAALRAAGEPVWRIGEAVPREAGTLKIV
jgi:selenide, water dikinase